MKTNILILWFLFIAFYINAQPGADCSNPYIINNIPFYSAGMTTSGYGNDFNDTSCCESNYMTGQDFIFRYTPAFDQEVNIFLTNTSYGTGLFVTKGCPSDTSSLCVEAVEASGGNPFIMSLALLKDTTYYITVSTYNFAQSNPYTDFDIDIHQTFQTDAGIYSFHNRSGCSLDSLEEIIIQVKNYGVDTLQDFLLGYSVNGSANVIDTFNNQLFPQDVAYFTFSQEYDMSASGTIYNVKAFTDIPTDSNKVNDSLETLLYNAPNISLLPYNQDFESGQADWITYVVNSSFSATSWELGQPANTIINSAASGTNAWVTNLDGDHNVKERSYLLSPCFDFTSYILPVFSMDIWYETESADHAVLEYSLDSGYTWNIIGAYNDPVNWYNETVGGNPGWSGSSGGWINASHTLDNLAGLPSVQFRIFFEGGINGTNEGLAIDNISIEESPMNDLSVVDIISPESGCGLGLSEDITVVIKNLGLNSRSDFEILFSDDSANSFISEIVNDTIDVGDSLIYTFSATADVSSTGINYLIAATNLTNDENISNDTLFREIFNYYTIDSYPYEEDFETDNGSWFSYGIKSTWEHGIPAGSVINTAASGSYAWVTNLDGLNNEAERSYLETPCFDFSNLLNPKLGINIWYDIEVLGTQLEISEDGGQNWAVLGSSADTNWYNQGYNWINHSSDWTEVSHTLLAYAGLQNVKFRFKFSGATQFDGFAVDDFEICDGPVAGYKWSYVNDTVILFTDTSLNSNNVDWIIEDSLYFGNLNPQYYFNAGDTLTVKQIVYNNCYTDTIIDEIYVSAINDLYFNDIKVYPNPANDELNILIDSENKEFRLQLYSILGQNVFDKFVSNTHKIDISSFKRGMYILKISDGEKVGSIKLAIH